VVEKLQGGAELMTPGLQNGPPFPQKAKKGSIVAIASLEAPTVPTVIGTCEIDVSALQNVRGAKGIAVSTVHWAGDEIWSWSTTGNPGIEPPDMIDGWAEGDSEEQDLAERTAAVDIDDQDGGVSLASAAGGASDTKAGNDEGKTDISEAIDIVDDKELTTKGRMTCITVAFKY
jgi:translation initiation factor 2D